MILKRTMYYNQLYTIVDGVPAKEIRKRFNDKTIKRLQNLQWWNFPPEKVKENIENIMNGDIDLLEEKNNMKEL